MGTPEGSQTPENICSVTARWPMHRMGQEGRPRKEVDQKKPKMCQGRTFKSHKERKEGGDVIHETQDIDTLLEEAERVGHSEEVLKILRQTKADQDRGIYRGGTIYGGN